MKNLFVRVLAVVALAVAATVQTMAQESFSYQAVIRDGNGTLVNSGKVGLRFTLLNGGKDYYVETQTAEPNKYGNISVMIGAGTKVSGDFAKVPWNTLDVTLKVEVDVKGGTDYKPLGETKLSPVPYAMYAASVDKAVGVGSAAKGAETLFEVDDRNGRPVFAVTNDGIVVYVDDQDSGKLRRSGFLVTGREATKGEPAKEYFSVTTDGTQIFVDEADDSKLRRSGFLVTGREATKNGSADYLSVDGNGTTVYVDGLDDSKLRRSGFLVTGREATKGEETSMFAVDGSTTTVYVEDQDGGKLRRSGFLVTGREATKSTERFVDVTADAVNLRTETFTVANTAPGDDAAAVPAPVLVVSRQLVEMKTDVAMEGDVLPATYGTFEKEYEFDLQLTCSTQYSILFDTLLARAGVRDFQSRYSYDSLMFVYDDGLTVGSTWEWGPSCLYFDQDFQRTSNSNNLAFYIRKYAETWTTVEFKSESNDLILHNFPVKLALGYYNSYDEYQNGEMHTVLITVNLTVDKMIYPYGIEKGTVKYALTTHAYYGSSPVIDTIEYCFNDYGWDDYKGIIVNGQQPQEGQGKYTWIIRSNNRSTTDCQGLDCGQNGMWGQYGQFGWFTQSGVGTADYPYFSLAGVNAPCNYYLPWYDRSDLALVGARDFDINNPKSVEKDTVMIHGRTYDVEKYTFVMQDDSSHVVTCTFYVYNGIVLKIDRQEAGQDKETILRSLEFTEESEPSFHRWLKNSGVTNYNGIVNGAFSGVEYDENPAHKYVDLNLPSGNLWASYNVGAPSSYDWGDYLAWGELEEKESYTQDGYFVTELISSCTNYDDYLNINDAAWKWGEMDGSSDWCMPTRADWQELIDNCFWVWIDGEPGVRVYEAEKSQDRGQSTTLNSVYDFEYMPEYQEVPYIFLPLSGSYDGTSLNNGMKGLYWASDKPSDQSNAYSLDISSPSNKQVKQNKRHQGMQVRAVAHKNTKYWVSETAQGEGDGSQQQPFKTIEQAIAIMDKNDGLMTYTLMVKGQIEPAEIINCGSVKQITLCGASGLDNNGEPKDAIVGNDGPRPLTVNSGNIRINNLKLTGGKSTEGGGIYVKDGATVTLDDGAVVSNNHGDKSELGQSGKYGGLGGGVFVDGGKLYMRGTARICNNTAGLASEEQDASYCGYGAGVFVNMGQFIMEGGTISGNEGIGASFNGFYQYTGYKVYYLDFSSGAGVYLNTAYGGRFVMSGGTISGNTIDIDANTSTIFINTIQGNNPNDEVHIEGGGNGVWFEAGCLCRGSWSDFSMSGGAYIDDIYMYCGHEAEPSNGCASGINITDELTTNKVMNISCSDEGNGIGDGAYLLMPGYNPDILDDGIIRRAVNKFKVTHEGYKIVPETVTDNYYFQGVVGKMVESGSK